MGNNTTDHCADQEICDTRRRGSLITPAQKPVIDAQEEVLGVSAPCQVIANACASGTNAIGHAFECVDQVATGAC